MKYNHNRTIDSFEPAINIIIDAGFNLIGVSQMYFFDVYIFETGGGAKDAYEKLERDGNLSGYWFSKEEFAKCKKKYESESEDEVEVNILWL